MEKYTDEKCIRPPQNLLELSDELKKIFAEDKVNIEYVKTLMELYESNPADWKKFAKFDQYRYTRNLVDEGNGKFNLMILCWNESQGSCIHSHANSHCFLKVLSGKIREEIFEWPEQSAPEQEMCMKRQSEFSKNQVTYINDSIGLHRMENPSHCEKAITLHLYSPPFIMCNMFDQKTGHRTQIPMTFWSKYGEKTPTDNQSCSQTGVSCTRQPENN